MRYNIIILVIVVLISAIWYLLISNGYYTKFDIHQKIIIWILTAMAVLVIGVTYFFKVVAKSIKQTEQLNDEEYWEHFYATSAQGYDSEELKNSQHDM